MRHVLCAVAALAGLAAGWLWSGPSPALLGAALLALRFVVLDWCWPLALYLLCHILVFTALGVPVEPVELAVVAGAAARLATGRGQSWARLWPAGPGRHGPLARVLIWSLVAVCLVLGGLHFGRRAGHFAEATQDPLPWVGLVAFSLAVTRILPAGRGQLVILVSLAGLAELCAGGALLATAALATPGWLLLLSGLYLGRRLDRSGVLGCGLVLVLAGLSGAPPAFTLLALFLVLRAGHGISADLAERAAREDEAARLGRTPVSRGVWPSASSVVAQLADGVNPAAWLLAVVAPLGRWLDGPPPFFD